MATVNRAHFVGLGTMSTQFVQKPLVGKKLQYTHHRSLHVLKKSAVA